MKFCIKGSRKDSFQLISFHLAKNVFSILLFQVIILTWILCGFTLLKQSLLLVMNHSLSLSVLILIFLQIYFFFFSPQIKNENHFKC